eukprot:scaffold102555_cov44-Cyclotella_meneghiniana.AAC.3
MMEGGLEGLAVVDRERSEINACCREATGGNSAVKGSIPRDYFKWSCLTWGNKYCFIFDIAMRYSDVTRRIIG